MSNLKLNSKLFRSITKYSKVSRNTIFGITAANCTLERLQWLQVCNYKAIRKKQSNMQLIFYAASCHQFSVVQF